MTRFFAVTGFSIFAVMLFLCNAGIGAAAAAAAFFLAALIISLCFKKCRSQRVLPVVLAAGLVSCILFSVHYYFRLSPALALDGQEVRISAVVTDEGENKYGKWYYPAKVTSVNGLDESFNIRFSFSKAKNAAPYDIIEGEFRVYSLSDANGGGVHVDASSHACVGAYSTDYSEDEVEIFAVAENKKPPMYRIIRLRERLREAIASTLNGDEAALAAAVLLGRTGEFPQRLGNLFNSVGLSHIICVSGLHLSVWCLLMLKIFKKLRLDLRAAAVLSAGFTVLFMALTGFSYSVNRAGIMMLIYLLAVFLSDSSDGINSLGISACIILAADPFAAANDGFLLSFLSTLGILTVSPRVSERLSPALKKIKPGVIKAAVKSVTATLTATGAALVFTLPVVLLHFGGLNFISFAGNLLVLPAASAAMISAGMTAVLILSTAIAPLGYAPGLFCSAVCRYIILVARVLSRSRLTAFYPDRRFSVIWLIFAAVCLGAILIAGSKRKTLRRVFAITIAASFAVFAAFSAVFSRKVIELKVIDCGDAVSVLVKDGGKTVLFGCGDGGFLSETNIPDAVTSARTGKLDCLFIPGEGENLSGCAAALARDFEIDKAIFPPEYTDGYIFPAGEPLCDGELSLPLKRCRAEVFGGGRAVFLNADGVGILMMFDRPEGAFSLPRGCDVPDIIITGSLDGINVRNTGTILSCAAPCADAVSTGGEGSVVLDIAHGHCFTHREGSFS